MHRVCSWGGWVCRYGILWLGFLTVWGCGEVENQIPAAAPPTVAPPSGKLYIANSGGGDLLVYDQASRIVGNRPPNRRLSMKLTGPVGVHLDATNDRLYVASADQNAILIFEQISQITSSSVLPSCPGTITAPCLRTLSGVNSQIKRPFDVFVDSTADRMFVANADSGTTRNLSDPRPGNILIFENASALSGDVPPSRSIGGPVSTLDFPRALTVDTTRDLLYVSNTGRNAILIFANASSASGDPAPLGSIQPPVDLAQDLTRLHLPMGLAIDGGNNRLYVANTGRDQSAVLIFDNASVRTGNTAPDRILQGNATRIADPVGVAYDPGSDTLYVSNQGDIFETGSENTQYATGQSTGSNTASTLNDTNAAYTVNQWVGGTLRIVGGKGSGQSRTVASNTATQFTITANWAITPDATSVYQLLLGSNSAPFPIPLDSLVIFPNISTLCPSAGVCSAAPGGVLTGKNTGLTDPAGLAVDLISELIYTANAGSNLLSVHGLTGDIAPVQINGGSASHLDRPAGIFYDKVHDRLFVANFGNVASSKGAILVWEKASQLNFNDTPPTWWIKGGTQGGVNFSETIRLYIDNSRNWMILMSGNNVLGYLAALNLSETLPPNPTPLGAQTITATPTTGALDVVWKVQDLYLPRGLAVDEGRGEIYLSIDECVSPVCSPPGGQNTTPRTVMVRDITNGAIKRVISSPDFSRPFGLALDTSQSSPVLYVANSPSIQAGVTTPQAILAFNNADTKSGNVFANRKITGAATRLSSPQGISLNKSTNRLYVANTGDKSILIFNAIGTLDGNVAPNRFIQGSNTGLTYTTSAAAYSPADVFVDTASGLDAIYTTEPTCPASIGSCSGAFLLFALQGNLQPRDSLSGNQALFGNGMAAAIDRTRDILYLSVRGADSLGDDRVYRVVDAGSTATGGTPTTALCSPVAAPSPCVDTGLNNPQGIAVDETRNILYIANGSTGGSGVCGTPPGSCPNTILAYTNSDTLSGNQAPARILSAASINDPMGLALVQGTDESLYVANSGGNNILVFSPARTASGATPPARILTGASLVRLVAVAVDPVSDFLYVAIPADTSTNPPTHGRILVYEQAGTLDGPLPSPDYIIGGDIQDPNLPHFTLNDPSGLNVEGGVLYVADAGANTVYAFEALSQTVLDLMSTFGGNQGLINQSILPTRTLTGNQTTLSQPTGLAVDSTR